jgi:hypothetical protein
MVNVDTENNKEKTPEASFVCEKCNDSGTYGFSTTTGRYIAPGPVPEDARGIAEAWCFDCDANRPRRR